MYVHEDNIETKIGGNYNGLEEKLLAFEKKFYFPIIKSYSICTLIANAAGVLISLFLSRNSDMIWIGAVSFSLMEIFEILSIHAGMMYFSCKNTKDLLEIDYE